MIHRPTLSQAFFSLAAAATGCVVMASAALQAAGSDGLSPGPVRMIPRQSMASVATRKIIPAALPGRLSGAPAIEESRPFSPERAEELANRIEMLSNGSAPVAERQALDQAQAQLPSFRNDLIDFSLSAIPDKQVNLLSRRMIELENLEGIALNGPHSAKAFHPAQPAPLPQGLKASTNRSDYFAGTSKVNTGWILDQHLFDPASYPTLYKDYRAYDEGRNDVVMGHSDHPSADTMFGWVWQVQSFYWSDTVSVTDHPNASYCLFVLVSQDGGATWLLYEILYDPSLTTSLDMVNPKMALDITGTGGGGPYDYDRFYIAYELAISPTDHNVYVYSETSVLDQPGPVYVDDPQTAAIATSTNMEQNPVIASDYMSGVTSYRVVAYEYAYSGTDYDIRASQSTGNGSTWSAAVDVAATTAMETYPAITAGATGDGSGTPFAAYMHLAYNFDAATSGGNLLLTDRGFETGPGETAWYKYCPLGHALITTTSTHSGTYKATLGGYNSDDDILSQLVTIPSDAAAAQLSFYLRITTAETTHPYDHLYVSVWDSTGPPGTWLADLATYSDADVMGWTLIGPIDLSAYIGQTIRIGFEATTDSGLATYFYIDDVNLSLSLSRVQYTQGAHSGGNYPAALQSFAKLTVLASAGGATAWPYGAPAIAASHGGSATSAKGRVLIAADQLFPADQPTAGDPARYQLIFAMNMCNGSTGCGDITPACTPDPVSLDWNAYWFYDNRTDYRYPALVVDGTGWVEGSSGIPQNGVINWWEMFMAYYTRPLSSTYNFGDAEMLMTDASDERCDGFQGGAWYWFTAKTNASDGDGKVVAKPGTLSAFNYFYGWPGITFNKRINHLGASVNDDVYFTTPGDNYTIDTLHNGAHIEARFTFSGNSYLGGWTFAWPAGFQMPVTADASTVDNDRYYTFSQWDTGVATTALTVFTAYYTPAGQFCPYGTGICQSTSINALYGGGCLVSPGEVNGVNASKSGSNPVLSWPIQGDPGDVDSYTIYRATNANAAGNFSAIGTTIATTYTDATAGGNLYFYIVTTGCGPYSGPWGHYGQ